MTPIQISYRLNKRQMAAAFQLATQRVRQDAGWRRVLLYMPALGVLILVVPPMLLGNNGVFFLGGIVGCLMISFGYSWYRDWWYEKYANSIGECRVTIDGDGVLIHSDICEARYAWAVVREISVQAGWLAMILGDIRAVQAVPDSAFSDAELRQAFLAAMREHGVPGVPDEASAARVAEREKPGD
ncbi:MAG: hypothetical protein LBQ81_13090 [Zoogloeaceae bacterium]|jgi:hypothetical protein|nr:hypothetical protein [Zoogloeaceae bacterium]